MGGGGVSLGKIVKGAGLQDFDVVSFNGSAPSNADVSSTLELDHAGRRTSNPERRLWTEFVERTRELHNQQCQRLAEMLSQPSAVANGIRMLIGEMKTASRVDWLRTADDKIVELRAIVTRWSDAETASLADVDTIFDLFRERHDQIDLQIGELKSLFKHHMDKLSHDLAQVRERMAQILNRDLEQIATALQTFVAQDRATAAAVQTQARDAAAVADSEFMQTRESAKDQEQLTTLRLHLASQIDAYEAEFAVRHAEYASVNGERQVELQAMIERDRTLSSVIYRNDLRQNRLRQSCDVARVHLQSHRTEARMRNQGLQNEITIMLRHVNELRRGLKGRRQRQATTATEISATASRVRSLLQQQLRRGERILRLHRVVHAQGGPGLSRKDGARLELVALRHERDRQMTDQGRLRAQLKSVFGSGAAITAIQHLLTINGH